MNLACFATAEKACLYPEREELATGQPVSLLALRPGIRLKKVHRIAL
jgi:hypothetical protein